jgi:23S rRNA (uracil1939-C5)-methyltransferase
MTASLSQWQQGTLLEITIAELSNGGDGVGRWEGRVVFVPNTVPGDRILARLIRVKPQYAYGKLQEIQEASPHRVRPSCIVADKCGGCQWQPVAYGYQLEAKRNLVLQDLERIGGFTAPPIDPVKAAPDELGYRNKATYPLMRSTVGQVQAGYYQKGSHLLINLNQCPIQDARLNPFLTQIKLDIQERGWGIYNEVEHRGKLRHLGMRIGRRTGEVLLTIVSRDANLDGIEAQAQDWMARYPELVGVCVNLNPDRTNAIFGIDTICIAGRHYLTEEFAGLQFRIQPATFFQVNTEQAEAVVEIIQQQLNLQGTETIVDAYCGIGTLTLPLAKQAKEAIAIEVQLEAVEQARLNAQINDISNVTFQIGAVEALLPRLTVHPEVVLLDPPRKGCDPSVIQTLLKLLPERIVYVSCNSATLARDLKGLGDRYQVDRIQPVDFFPQTAHVECVAFLTLR